MDGLLQYQEELKNLFKNIVFLFCLFIVVILVLYNWLYLSKIRKSNDKFGLRPPRHMHHLVRTCILVPIFAAVFILFFILFRIY